MPTTNRAASDLVQETPTPSASKRRRRWDETPAALTPAANATPSSALTPSTPHTPSMTPEQIHALHWEHDIDKRNRHMKNAFPPWCTRSSRRPRGTCPSAPRKLTATPTSMLGTPQGFYMKKEGMTPRHTDDAQPNGNLPLLKPKDA